MRRRMFVGCLALLGLKLALPRTCLAILEDKEIYFWLDKQMGAAYENGHLVRYFRILSGFDGIVITPDGKRVYAPTPKGKHKITNKVIKGYSRTYRTEMPYAMEFKEGYYIHGWSWNEPLPPPGHRFASRGCINLDLPDAEWLYFWTPKGTPVYIWFKRTK